MAKHDDPIEQIRVFLTSLWAGKLSPEVVRALSLYNLTLSADAPDRSRARARAPARRAARGGGARHRGRVRCATTSAARRLAEILLHTGNAAVHTTILHTGSESPDDVWAFCLGGLRART